MCIKRGIFLLATLSRALSVVFPYVSPFPSRYERDITVS